MKATPPPERILGVRWLNARGNYSISSGTSSITTMIPSGSGFLKVLENKDTKLCTITATSLEKRSQGWRVAVPNTFRELPFKTLIFDFSSGLHHLFETADLVVPPGGYYYCRFANIGKGVREFEELEVRLERLYREKESISLRLKGPGKDGLGAKLPELQEGLWIMRYSGDGALNGSPLALVVVARKAPTTVSVYTYRNRRGYSRGKSVELFWTVRVPRGKKAERFKLVLRGVELRKALSEVKPSGGEVESGYLRLDTESIAPGRYDVVVEGDGVVCYPAHFFVYQREPVTDFDTYSYLFGKVPMEPDVGVVEYCGQGTEANEPGLLPIVEELLDGLDSAFAVFAGSFGGPALEKCIIPDPDEVGLMALASLGKRVVLDMPKTIHHEDWNPKHTLPEELMRLRRRNALFTQRYTDIAGFSGINLNWYPTLFGYWEEVPRLDGHQARRNTEVKRWISEKVAKEVEKAKKRGAGLEELKIVEREARYEYWSLVLPSAYREWLRDAKAIKPDLTSHSGIPSFWLGKSGYYPPLAYRTLTDRDAVDYTDYGRPPWSNFRVPAFLSMGNPEGQKIRMSSSARGRHARFIVSFASVGRGLDGFALPAQAIQK